MCLHDVGCFNCSCRSLNIIYEMLHVCPTNSALDHIFCNLAFVYNFSFTLSCGHVQRVTVICQSVCLSVCLSVCSILLFNWYNLKTKDATDSQLC